MTQRTTVRAEHDYEVLVGNDLTDHLLTHLGGAARRLVVVHQPVLRARARALRDVLAGHGHDARLAEVPDGEAAKTLEVLADLWDRLGEAAFTRGDLVVGLGGGAVTDLAGFLAATWLRGVPVIQLPTTLLAMVDAAVGGKTGINTPQGKNLVGAFHSPQLVLCDLEHLTTLPAADHAAGLAEVVKCGFIADERILELIETDGGSAARDPRSATLAELVTRAIAVKAEIVSADLREAGRREFLNYGHTMAHAVELVEGFTWRHGEAVALGMVFVAELAHRRGLLDDAGLARHRYVLTALGLPTTYRQDTWAPLRTAMGRDKKTRGTTLRFVVLESVGRPTRLVAPTEDELVGAYRSLAPAAVATPQPTRPTP